MKQLAHALPAPFGRRQSGASMIEVLVASLIFSVGLLGVASTQTVGLTNTQSALHRSYAAQLSYELIDLIRANPVEARKTTSVFANYDSTDPDPTDPGTDPVPTAVPACQVQSTTGCRADEMANTVLAQWTARLQATLPDGEAELTRVGDIFELRIRWADFRNDQIMQDFKKDPIERDKILDQIADRITEFRI